MDAGFFPDELTRISGVQVGFVERIPGVDVAVDKAEALRRLDPYHRAAVQASFGRSNWWTAEQVHAAEVAVIDGGEPTEMAGCDGLMTDQSDCLLGIYVADCGVIWLVDRATRAVAILHSGKAGTEQRILPMALERMHARYGTRASDVIAFLGPCIRPPHYEVDFAAEIGRQAATAGVGEYHDCGLDTAVDLTRYYSYRMERGKTGRMLGLIMRSG